MPARDQHSILTLMISLTAEMHSANGDGKDGGDGKLGYPSVLELRPKHDEHNVQRYNHGTGRDDDRSDNIRRLVSDVWHADDRELPNIVCEASKSSAPAPERTYACQRHQIQRSSQ